MLFRSVLDQITNNGNSGYDLVMAVLSQSMCWSSGTTHMGVNGLAFVSGGHSVVVNKASMPEWQRVRIIQHELSHNWGNEHKDITPCTPLQRCIMGGYNPYSTNPNNDDYNLDGISVYNLPTIWCDVHANTFIPDYHG